MKRFSLLFLVTIMLTAFAASAMAVQPVACQQARIQSFDFLLDYSGSMMMFHKQLGENKFKLAKAALKRVNDRIPELGYTGSVNIFGASTVSKTSTVVPQQSYNRAAFQKGFDSLKATYEVFARLTPLGDAIQGLAGSLYAGLPSPSAVILVSDGENNRGVDPVAAAQAAISANPGLVFHIISLADSPKGEAVLEAIANLKPRESVFVRAQNLIDHDIIADGFTTEVFCAGGSIVLRSVQFALGSAAITSESAAVLNEVAKILSSNKADVSIAGHTCSIGSEQVNQVLSERRAAAVKSYLVKKGIPAGSITTRGYGKDNPKYDNSTEQGRRLNRRAEIDFNRQTDIDFNYRKADVDFGGKF
ncbi:MAG: OmpA family protein [Desulfovibrio sp.]|jgi:OOP family OmpA-OmpF porin|nr:OmpA family protein [Desulfovibrio sp.]